jgi:flagellar biosynthesis/type III secretory pathway M-ring protein FliF/YscJ
MTVKIIPCLSWKIHLFTLFFKINFIYNQVAKKLEKGILNMDEIIKHKGSDFSFTSPIVLGSVGVVALIVLVLMVIYYLRNKQAPEEEKKPIVKKEENNEKKDTKEGKDIIEEEEECKEVENIENVEKPEVIDKEDITLGIYRIN